MATFICGTCTKELPEDFPWRRLRKVSDGKRMCEDCLLAEKGMSFDDWNRALAELNVAPAGRDAVGSS